MTARFEFSGVQAARRTYDPSPGSFWQRQPEAVPGPVPVRAASQTESKFRVKFCKVNLKSAVLTARPGGHKAVNLNLKPATTGPSGSSPKRDWSGQTSLVTKVKPAFYFVYGLV